METKSERLKLAFWRRLPRSAWVDTLLLSAVLAGMNLLISPRDLGWLRVNPSPHLLVPLLIGSRYGFSPGVLSALWVVLLLGAAQVFQGAVLPTLLYEQGFFYSAFLVCGAVCGELSNHFKQKEMSARLRNDLLQDRVSALDVELELLLRSHTDLEQMLATRDTEISTLNTNVRRLFESAPEQLYQNILLLLNRQVRITDAAIYWRQSEEQFQKVAAIGSAKEMPEKLEPGAHDMMDLAIKRADTVSVPEFWGRSSPTEQALDWLLVTPFVTSTHQVRALLVVTGIPFMAMTKKSVQLTSTICRWAARVIEMSQINASASAPGAVKPLRVLMTDFFKENLKLAHASCREHRMPSSLVLFQNPHQPKTWQKELEKIILPNIRIGDICAELNLPVPHLAVFLPLTGERGTKIFVERVRISCQRYGALGGQIRSEQFFIKPEQDFASFWEELTSEQRTK